MARGTRQTKAPTATHVVEYKQKETATDALVGKEVPQPKKMAPLESASLFLKISKKIVADPATDFLMAVF